MPQRDSSHEAIKQALINDGWAITHDPYTLAYGGERGYIDLGSARFVSAAQNNRTIAIEIKTFSGPSCVADLEQAMGQYVIYRSWMRRVDPERELWLAVSLPVANSIFSTRAAEAVLEDYDVHLLIVDVVQERIVTWKRYP